MNISEAADWHLTQWARWMRQDGEAINELVGYKAKSGPFYSGGLSSADTWGHMCEADDARQVMIVDRIMTHDISRLHYAAISNVYLAHVWRFRGDPLAVFGAAVASFWELAVRAGLR